MKLFVDGQTFQTGALERGMGTLTIELLRAAKKQAPELDVTILLNDKLPMAHEHQRRLHVMLEGFSLDHISLETPKTGPESAAKRELEAYIAKHTHAGEEAVYLVPALFLFDYFALFPHNCKTVLIFHDLIPLVMWKYLKNVFPGHVYFARFSRIFEADIILANSANTKMELVRLLGVLKDNVVVMGGAPETITMSKGEAQERVKALGITGPYVLLPTGGGHMHHKNNLRAAEALHLLRRDVDHDFTVVATSRYEEHERQAMHRYLGRSIMFTGNVSVADMQALYRCAAVTLVPSLTEGLGIPLLNAVSQGTPVAASDIPVFAELSEGAPTFYGFDPFDVWDMRDKIFAALARVGFAKKQELYKRLLEQYTWAHCADHLLAALQKTPTPRPAASKHLDVLMPDPMADINQGYLAQSLVATARNHGYDVSYYIDPSERPPHYDDRGADYIRYIASTHDIIAYDANSATPKLVFLPQGADFMRLHLLTRLVENAIIYISADVSDRLYDAMLERNVLDANTAAHEKQAQQQLAEAGMFNVPHPLVKARGILVEERTADRLQKTLVALGVTCPVQVVPDNYNDNLNDYVHEVESRSDVILDFVEKVLHHD